MPCRSWLAHRQCLRYSKLYAGWHLFRNIRACSHCCSYLITDYPRLSSLFPLWHGCPSLIYLYAIITKSIITIRALNEQLYFREKKKINRVKGWQRSLGPFRALEAWTSFVMIGGRTGTPQSCLTWATGTLPTFSMQWFCLCLPLGQEFPLKPQIGWVGCEGLQGSLLWDGHHGAKGMLWRLVSERVLWCSMGFAF